MEVNKLEQFETVIVSLNTITMNENNPRFIRDEKLEKLIESVKAFPQMLKIRPIVVNKEMKILGGNMRYRACVEAGLKEIPVIVANGLTEEQELEFLIKDNVSGGEWDWDKLINDWDTSKLEEWGLETFDVGNTDVELDEFFEDTDNEPQSEEKNQIVLEYTGEEYDKIMEVLNSKNGTKEHIIYSLLVNEE